MEPAPKDDLFYNVEKRKQVDIPPVRTTSEENQISLDKKHSKGRTISLRVGKIYDIYNLRKVIMEVLKENEEISKDLNDSINGENKRNAVKEHSKIRKCTTKKTKTYINQT